MNKYQSFLLLGIRVTNICPGYVKTNVSVNALTGSGEAFGTMDDQIAGGMAVERYCICIVFNISYVKKYRRSLIFNISLC